MRTEPRDFIKEGLWWLYYAGGSFGRGQVAVSSMLGPSTCYTSQAFCKQIYSVLQRWKKVEKTAIFKQFNFHVSRVVL